MDVKTNKLVWMDGCTYGRMNKPTQRNKL